MGASIGISRLQSQQLHVTKYLFLLLHFRDIHFYQSSGSSIKVELDKNGFELMTAICLPCGQALEEAAAQAAEEERRRLQTQTELQDRYRTDLEKEKLVRLPLHTVSLRMC